MVKALILLFRYIQQLLIRDTHAKFDIPNLPQPPNMGQNSDRGLFNFRISGKILYK